MNDKQIFVSLEIADHEVRMIVGEFFNTRFNIIKVERVPVNGLSYNAVTNEDAIVDAIRRASAQVKKMVGAKVEKIILGLPSYNMKRYGFKSSVDVDGIDGKVTIQDVRKAISRCQRAKVDPKYIPIQVVPVRYTVNGVTSKRIPIDEKCDTLTVDVDLLCADKKLTYDIVSCVEKSGLDIIDIFLDTYAIGKESALFEQATKQQVIMLKLERESTTLGLLKDGRLITGTIIPNGLGTIASGTVDKYGIKSDIAIDLLKYSVRLSASDLSKNPVHIWSDEGETRTINEQELFDSLHENLELWLNDIQKTCIPILQAGETTVMITGEGGETNGLDELVKRRLKVDTSVYIPETLGGRNASLTACLGLFYAYQDKLPISGYHVNSLDMDEFLKSVSYRNQSGENKENTLTNKLKGLFRERG